MNPFQLHQNLGLKLFKLLLEQTFTELRFGS